MSGEQRPSVEDRRIQHQISLQAQQIERVFSHHQLPARVAGGAVERRSIQFDLQAQLAAGRESLRRLVADLKAALGVSDLRLSRENDQWRLQVARPYEPPVPLLQLMELINELPPATAVLGLAEEGRPLLLNFTAERTRHVLICGEENAGKTVLLRTIAASLALASRQAEAQLVVIAPANARSSGDDGPELLQPLAFLPHTLADVARTMPDIIHVLQFLEGEMAYREEQRFSAPRIVVLIDRAVLLFEKGGRQAEGAIQRLLQHGAASGIHLVMSTRRPAAPSLGTMLKANIPARIVGLMQDEEAIRAGAEEMVQAAYLLGEGDFFALLNGTATHFQGAYIGDYDLHMELKRLHGRRPVLMVRPYEVRMRLPETEETPPNGTAEGQRFSFVEGEG